MLSTVPSVWGGLGLAWRVLLCIVERRVQEGVERGGGGGASAGMRAKRGLEEGSLEECVVAVVWVCVLGTFWSEERHLLSWSSSTIDIFAILPFSF